MNREAVRSIFTIIFTLFFLTEYTSAQQKFTLEQAFKDKIFNPKDIKRIKWNTNGKTFSILEKNKEENTESIVLYNTSSGEIKETILNSQNLRNSDGKQIHVDNYSINKDENIILIESEIDSIYRRSTKAFYYIYDVDSKNITSIDSENKQMHVTFSPDGGKVAYVINNNIYIKNLADQKVTQITEDGELHKIINGSADWVYEEEFHMSKAFKWSHDSKMIAYIKYDEREVKEYSLQIWGELYPEFERFKYPKAGEKNSVTSIHVYDLESRNTTEINTGNVTDIYLPRIYWVPESQSLAFIKLNRLQNNLELYFSDPKTGTSELILSETSNTFIDLNFTDDLKFLEDGQSFLKTSEKSGFKHIYHYNIDGTPVSQITDGEWEVDKFYGINEKSETLYFTSTEVSPTERHLYSVRIDGSKKQKMTREEGVNKIDFNEDLSFYINKHTSDDTPLKVSLCNGKGKVIKVLKDNPNLKDIAKKYQLVNRQFFEFSAGDGKKLHGYMLKPADFDIEKKYPVLMFLYGGPGKQTVMNEWGGNHELWHQYLVQQGYIVVSVDNRGTDGRGVEFKHCTYGQMGKLEVQDQIRIAKYLAEQKYVDKSRIGIWGWSYGGYMSSLSLFIGDETFKTGIAVAPVTNWRFYDTIYTERYQGLPQKNPGGYDDYSPIHHVDKLKGNYLIIHGTGDDNVHLQNSMEMINALILKGKQFDTFFYPNKDHSIKGGNTKYHLYSLMTNFILENL